VYSGQSLFKVSENSPLKDISATFTHRIRSSHIPIYVLFGIILNIINTLAAIFTASFISLVRFEQYIWHIIGFILKKQRHIQICCT